MNKNRQHEHLTDDQIEGFIFETLDDEEQTRVESHIEYCEHCAAGLEAYYEYEVDEEQVVRDNQVFLAKLREKLLGIKPSPAPFWERLENLVLSVPESLRLALQTYVQNFQPAHAFSMKSSKPALAFAAQGAVDRSEGDVIEGKSTDGEVAWSLWVDQGNKDLHVNVASPRPERLVGKRIRVTLDGKPITGSDDLPDLELTACGSEALATAVLPFDRIAALLSEPGVQLERFELRLKRVEDEEEKEQS